MEIFPIIQPELFERKETDGDNVSKDVEWEEGEPVIRNGNPVFSDGQSAMRGWIERCLLTKKGAHAVQTYEYGINLEDILYGRAATDAMKSEARRLITEALSENEFIESVDDVQVWAEDSILEISCKVTTIYGEEVEADV